jgi:hypothetical protein
MWVTNRIPVMRIALHYGDVAQLGEWLVRNQQASGSIPDISTKSSGRGGTADTLVSEASGRNPVEVQIFSTAPILLKGKTMTNKEFLYPA